VFIKAPVPSNNKLKRSRIILYAQLTCFSASKQGFLERIIFHSQAMQCMCRGDVPAGGGGDLPAGGGGDLPAGGGGDLPAGGGGDLPAGGGGDLPAVGGGDLPAGGGGDLPAGGGGDLPAGGGGDLPAGGGGDLPAGGGGDLPVGGGGDLPAGGGGDLPAGGGGDFPGFGHMTVPSRPPHMTIPLDLRTLWLLNSRRKTRHRLLPWLHDTQYVDCDLHIIRIRIH
jgi:hypothetical protein